MEFSSQSTPGRAPASSRGRPGIMVVAALGRPDIVSMFAELARIADLTFVEYERNWGEGLDPGVYAGFGTLTTWEEHPSAGALLARINPDRIAMIAIGSRNQLVLRAEALRRGIEVVHVEHGYRLPPGVRSAPGFRVGARRGPRAGTRTNRFFVQSAFRAGPRIAAAGLEASIRPPERTTRLLARTRRPDRYVSFSPECFEYHRVVDRVPDALASRTTYVGIPQFDCFDRSAITAHAPALAVMADHQLHNGGIRGWDESFRRSWAKRLVDVLRDRGFRLCVKRHPGDRSDVWSRFRDGSVVEVETTEQLADMNRRASLALGTGSTLQLPLAARDQMATITLEIHPNAGPALSERLVQAGVAAEAQSFSELGELLDSAETLAREQQRQKDAFVAQFLHRLDGAAGLRLASALLGSVED